MSRFATAPVCSRLGAIFCFFSLTVNFSAMSAPLADINNIPDASNRLAVAPFNELVGEIKGQSSVDGGAFSYSVPMTIAPGRKGMQPSISLNYSSQSGEGLAGLGWSVSAYSSISRCSSIYDLDATSVNVSYGNADKLCFNGSRLVVVIPPNGTSQGVYGAFGTFYKTERNSSVIIEQLGGSLNSSSAYFKVYEGNGTVHFLGTDANSKITPVGLGVPSAWLQKRSQDLHGNEVSYVYDTSSAGNRYIQDIYYTGFKGVYGTRNVRFNYTAIPAKTSYHWGGYSVSNKQISSIDMVIDGQLKSQWQFNYSVPALNAMNKTPTLERLSYCDGADLTQCLNTDFGWFNRNYQHTYTANHSLDRIQDNFTVGFSVSKDSDYDGDGVADLSIPLDGIYLSRTGQKVTYQSMPMISTRFSDGTADFNGDQIISAYEIDRNTINGSMDYDLDGADDFVYLDENSRIIITSLHPDGRIKRTFNTQIDATCYGSTYYIIGDKFCTSYVMDIDGDGRKDLLVATNKQAGANSSTITYQVFQRKKNDEGFDFRGSVNVTALEPLVPMDVDGDGTTDLAPSRFGTSLIWYKGSFNRTNNSVSFTPFEQNFSLNVDFTLRKNPSRWVDLNGDGLSDILTLSKASSSDNFFTRYVIINKGAGLFEAPYKTTMKELAFTMNGGHIVSDPEFDGPDGYIYEGFVQFVDYNGDGRQDILYPDRSRRKYTYECWNWSSNEACMAVDRDFAPKFHDYDVWHWNVLLTNPDGKSFTDVQLPIYGALATLTPIDLTGMAVLILCRVWDTSQKQ